jgi:hypothetical protein
MKVNAILYHKESEFNLNNKILILKDCMENKRGKL